MPAAASRVALVTARAALGTDIDLAPLLEALGAHDIAADAPCWDDPGVDWASYDLAVLRSPWDYVSRYAEFLAWIDAVAARVRVLNPPEIVRWNTDKRYLAELAHRGLAVVPTRFFEPGDFEPGDFEPGGFEPGDFEPGGFEPGGFEPAGATPRLDHDAGELVVKPVISAGSKDTARHSDPRAAEEHVRHLLAQDRAVMVQPYQHAIDTYGETGLVFFDGELSHAFRKAPILALDAPPTAEFFAPEEITPRDPSPDERELAEATIAGCGPDLLYARVDLVPASDGRPQILEVELAEPSYFLGQSPGSADRFAAAVQRRL